MPQTPTDKFDVAIIGGGVIGVCIAYALTQRGTRVVVIDKGEIGSGASHGNAGWVVPSHSIPLATADAVKNGIKWMLNPESPFYIQPRLDPALWAWLVQFAWAARPSAVQRAIPVLRDLNAASRKLYDALAATPGLSFGYRQKGMLTVFKTAQGYAGGEHEAHVLREFDQACTLLSRDETLAMAPMLKPDLAGGLFFPDDAHLDPAAFVQQLAALAQQHGACLITHAEVQRFETRGPRVVRAHTSQGEIGAEQFVLAAGAWSPQLAHDLQLRLPVQPGKGYSVTVPWPDEAEPLPEMPISFAEARAVVTPFDRRLRIAGTMELAGLNAQVNPRRVKAIVKAAQAHLVGLDSLVLEQSEVWGGMRPCTPDGLPIMGRSPALSNLIVATGHAMMGISLGPITGQLVAQLACQETPEMDLMPLRLDRF